MKTAKKSIRLVYEISLYVGFLTFAHYLFKFVRILF